MTDHDSAVSPSSRLLMKSTRLFWRAGQCLPSADWSKTNDWRSRGVRLMSWRQTDILLTHSAALDGSSSGFQSLLAKLAILSLIAWKYNTRCTKNVSCC